VGKANRGLYKGRPNVPVYQGQSRGLAKVIQTGGIRDRPREGERTSDAMERWPWVGVQVFRGRNSSRD